jgi:hypothetical protein
MINRNNLFQQTLPTPHKHNKKKLIRINYIRGRNGSPLNTIPNKAAITKMISGLFIRYIPNRKCVLVAMVIAAFWDSKF